MPYLARGSVRESRFRASAENVRNQVTAKCGMMASMKVNNREFGHSQGRPWSCQLSSATFTVFSPTPVPPSRPWNMGWWCETCIGTWLRCMKKAAILLEIVSIKGPQPPHWWFGLGFARLPQNLHPRLSKPRSISLGSARAPLIILVFASVHSRSNPHTVNLPSKYITVT
jgi:hypothetical protein